eukprot:9057186-Pyramimonas_sp.AAC.1
MCTCLLLTAACPRPRRVGQRAGRSSTLPPLGLAPRPARDRPAAASRGGPSAPSPCHRPSSASLAT